MIRAKLDHTPAPPPKGPTRRVMRRLFYGATSSGAVAAVALFGFNTFGVASNICTLPGAQPGLSDFCGACRMGERPSREERLAWAARPAGSCQALRDHIVRFPEGAYRREAADLLTARQVTTEDAWSPSTRQLALYQPQLTEGAPDEPAAHARALAAAQTQADNLCRGFAAATSFRFRTATPQPSSLDLRARRRRRGLRLRGHGQLPARRKGQRRARNLRPAPHGAGRGLGTISLKRWAGEPPLGVTAEVAEDSGIG